MNEEFTNAARADMIAHLHRLEVGEFISSGVVPHALSIRHTMESVKVLPSDDGPAPLERRFYEKTQDGWIRIS